jgi:hypothetical protein
MYHMFAFALFYFFFTSEAQKKNLVTLLKPKKRTWLHLWSPKKNLVTLLKPNKKRLHFWPFFLRKMRHQKRHHNLPNPPPPPPHPTLSQNYVFGTCEVVFHPGRGVGGGNVNPVLSTNASFKSDYEGWLQIMPLDSVSFMNGFCAVSPSGLKSQSTAPPWTVHLLNTVNLPKVSIGPCWSHSVLIGTRNTGDP